MYGHISIHGPGQGKATCSAAWDTVYGTASESGAWSLEPVTAGCFQVPARRRAMIAIGAASGGFCQLLAPAPTPSPASAPAPASTARIRSRIAIAIAIANVSNNDIEFCGRKVGRIYLVTVLLVLYIR